MLVGQDFRIAGLQDCKNTYLVNLVILKYCLLFIKIFMLHQELTKKIIGCAYTVHNTLGAGFLEKVYEQALMLELKVSGLVVESQVPLSVIYRDQIVGEYYADLIVEDKVICELKAVDVLKKAHEVQLVNYLVATGMDVGVLINFGDSVTVRRKYREYKKQSD